MKNQYNAHLLAWLVLVILVFAISKTHAQSISLGMNDAVKMAVAHNRELKSDSLNIGRAQQQTIVSKALLLPNIGITGQYQRYFQKPVFFGLGSGAPTTSKAVPYSRFGGDDQVGATVGLVQSLYNPSAVAGLKQAKLYEQQSVLLYRDKEADVTATVKQVYLRMLVLAKRLQLQMESITRNKKALEDSRSLLAQGKALRVDTLRAYTNLQNLQPDIMRLTYAINVSRQQLKVLLALEEKAELTLTDSLSYNVADVLPDESGVYTEALHQRPDLKALELNKTISLSEVDVAKAGKMPVLNLISAYQVQSQANGFKWGGSSWPPVSYAGLQFAIPLFSGNANKAKIARARIGAEQSAVNYTNAQEQLRVSVKQVVANLAETTQRIQVQNKVAETAALSYSITQYRYERGVASRLELLDAELGLTTAKSNYLEAVYDYQSARIDLERVLAAKGN
ncbi:TolC family protein [Mucilaginibacter mali]|uniref:TolC family protein n=1 Tax=Mucilaginibacter mali TaxID=2740462 RepID=A0A7D4TTC9_9SPHI|nr:TolC family protein [Mucilaginibacter mali]QKJ28895.1 TolC family protein [Mucilaginibacter mali]